MSVTPATEAITRGAMRLLHDLGYAPLTEVSLTNRRRADIIGLGNRGQVTLVEVKSCLSDFRSDGKWTEYLAYCEEFYFAVDAAFPCAVLEEASSLPQVTGIMIADQYGAEIIRPAATRRVNAARRKKLTLTMARTGAQRLASGLLAPARPELPTVRPL
jgi:hypothetical protein